MKDYRRSEQKVLKSAVWSSLLIFCTSYIHVKIIIITPFTKKCDFQTQTTYCTARSLGKMYDFISSYLRLMTIYIHKVFLTYHTKLLNFFWIPDVTKQYMYTFSFHTV